METIDSLEQCYAKTRNNELAENILQHGILSGLIAKHIMIINGLSLHSSTPFIVSLHDIGKISYIFQLKIRKDDEYKKYKAYEEGLGFHSGIGYKFLKKYLGEKNKIAEAISRHHGFSVEESPKSYDGIVNNERYDFHKLRIDFFEKMKLKFGVENVENFAGFDNQLLSGLISVSDWIASGLFFDLKDRLVDENIEKIIYDRLLSMFKKPKLKEGLGFSDIFKNYVPTETQKSFYESIDKPGIYFIEEQAGNGKSEIAFYSSYKIMEKNKDINGIYFALPTVLTANSMLDRLQSFLDSILIEKQDSKLIHSESELYLLYNNLQKEKEFLDEKNLKLLNSFAVGTVDQLLLSVLNSKFNFLKTFGLYKKIIIIDEVHCYDQYTTNLIKYLIDNAEKLGCYVIILSATLSNSAKDILMPKKERFANQYYPLLTKVSNNNIEEFIIPPNKENSKEYFIDILHNDMIAIDCAIQDAKNGLQVLWIENTVIKSQSIYYVISDRIKKENLDIEIGLIHSKFLPTDKYKLENEWIDKYGKSSKIRNKKGRILIGTQILEQSIDIDADVLYTRLTYIDLLIQRIGRCWRHKNRNKERKIDKAVVHILSESSDQVIKKDIKDWFIKFDDNEFSGLIYFKYFMYKTLCFFEKNKKIILPFDLRKMINYVYDDPQEEECQKLKGLRREYSMLSKDRVDKSVNSKVKDLFTKSNSEAKTRLIDNDEQDVVIFKFNESKNKIFLDGGSLTPDYYKNKVLLDQNTISIKKDRLRKLDKDNELKEKYNFDYCLFLDDKEQLHYIKNGNFECSGMKYNSLCGLF